MSFSTALQSLRLPAASAAWRRAALSPSTGSRASSSSSSPSQQHSHLGSKNSRASHRPHAPHGHLNLGVAGPSRCFCSSSRRHKASELPLEELHYQTSLDSYRHDSLTTSDYWQPHSASGSLTPAKRQSCHAQEHDLEPAPSICASFFPDTQHLQVESATNDFFTPSVRQRTGKPASAAMETASLKEHKEQTAPAFVAPPSYIDTLELHHRTVLDDRIRLLLRSGEHSMLALTAVHGDITPLQREQICCHILTQCIREAQDCSTVWDLYRTWPSVSHIDVDPAGPERSMLRRMQGDALYKCAGFLHAAGLTRQAAMIVGDTRMKPSQSRFLLERLVYDVKLPARSETSGEVAAADVRAAVREMCDAMTSLLADGVVFKRKVINRMLKLLCLTKARSRLVRLVRGAQRRAQLEAVPAEDFRAAGGFSRLRMENGKVPQVVSTKVMEEVIRLLCAQDATGGRTAYELLCILDDGQRTSAMYDALMTRYASSTETVDEGRRTVDEQLWDDIRRMGGPTLKTISARIVCHARRRRLDAIQADLAFSRSAKLGGINELTRNAKLSIVRCAVETGSLLAGFRYASTIIAGSTEAFHSEVIATLLRAAQHIRLASSGSSPSKAQLLKRFLRHFSHLHAKHPHLQPDVEQLRLVIELLDRHSAWIETATVWNMLRLVGRHFGSQDERLVGILQVFARVFERRDDAESAKELQLLIGKLQQQSCATKT